MATSPIYGSRSHSSRDQVQPSRPRPAEVRARDTATAQELRALLRSPTMWAVLYLPGLTAIALLVYMMLHLDRGPARAPGVGDRGSPNAQPGDK
jgi:hypothetical protein